MNVKGGFFAEPLTTTVFLWLPLVSVIVVECEPAEEGLYVIVSEPPVFAIEVVLMANSVVLLDETVIADDKSVPDTVIVLVSVVSAVISPKSTEEGDTEYYVIYNHDQGLSTFTVEGTTGDAADSDHGHTYTVAATMLYGPTTWTGTITPYEEGTADGE